MNMKKNKVKLVLKVESTTEIERLISIINIGICVAIDNQVLSTQEAEDYLYSPYTMARLQELGVSQELIDTVHFGTELENVERLIPEKFSESLEEIKIEALKVLKSLPPTNFPRNRWIERECDHS